MLRDHKAVIAADVAATTDAADDSSSKRRRVDSAASAAGGGGGGGGASTAKVPALVPPSRAAVEQASPHYQQGSADSSVGSIPRVAAADLTPARFKAEYLALGKPVIITGATKDWSVTTTCLL